MEALRLGGDGGPALRHGVEAGVVQQAKGHAQVHLALAVAGALAAADASARADDAADQYISDVQSHIDAIFGAEDFRARAEVVDDRAVLTEVMFGETMSESYRTALDIEAEYEALINDASPILKQRHSSTDLRAFLGDLSDILGAEGKAALAEYGRKSGTPTAMFERMQPWLVSLMVTLGEAQKAGYKPELGIDPFLMRRAREAGQATAGLETAESQFAVLASPDQEVQVGMLLKLLDQVESLETLHELYRLWRTGDAAGMDAYAAREFAEYPEYYDRINVDRNRAWVPQIVRMAGEDKHVVIVVGALHTVGKDGVPALLEAEGLRVERIACTRCR